MHRFFLPEGCIKQDSVDISGEIVHRLRNVLRLRRGDHIIVLDNAGWEYEVELGTMSREAVEGSVVGKAAAAGEPVTGVTLYQALLKGSSFELVLQKCTEIGVSCFVPVVCERCVTGEPGKDRLARWKDIILEAAQQSRRGKLPRLHNVVSFREACCSVQGLSFLPWEGEETGGVRDLLRGTPDSGKADEVGIYIGPEGGFSVEEVEYARSCGITPVSLGRRILRAETAGLVAAAVVLYEFGELNAR